MNQDDLETVDLLLRSGASVKAANRYGVTALSLACTTETAQSPSDCSRPAPTPTPHCPEGNRFDDGRPTGKVEAVQALLSHGAVVDAKESQRGQTAIIVWPRRKATWKPWEALDQSRSRFSRSSDSGYTPLMFAVREGRIGGPSAA